MIELREDGRIACTNSEMLALEKFMKGVGVRIRYCMAYTDETLNERVYIIEADNPYRSWIVELERHFADALMSDGAIKRYQE